jgi:hypothetical protein
MIEIILEPNSNKSFHFTRSEVNDNLMVNGGETPEIALINIAEMILEVEEVDIFEKGFTLIPQSKLDKEDSQLETPV